MGGGVVLGGVVMGGVVMGGVVMGGVVAVAAVDVLGESGSSSAMLSSAKTSPSSLAVVLLSERRERTRFVARSAVLSWAVASESSTSP